MIITLIKNRILIKLDLKCLHNSMGIYILHIPTRRSHAQQTRMEIEIN